MSITLNVEGASVARLSAALVDAGFDCREHVEWGDQLVFATVWTPGGYSCGTLSCVGDYSAGLLRLNTGWIEAPDLIRLVEGLDGQGLL